MSKKLTFLTLIACCLLFASIQAFALDFEKLPGGIDVSIIPDNHEIIQTGETENGVIYVISSTITNNSDGAGLSPYLGNINIVGFSRSEGTIVYNVTYVQAGKYCKISSASKNYFYYVKAQNGRHEIVKIDLSTGSSASSPTNGVLPGPIPTSGTFSTQDGQTIATKFIAVNENDEIYILGKRSDNVIRVVQYSGTAWINFITDPFPSPNSSGTPNAFCATLDGADNKICYSSFGSTLYKTTKTSHATCPGLPSGTYYGVSIMAGVNAGDAIFAFYSTSVGYVYYYNNSNFATVKCVETGANFTNKYFNLVYINGSSKASFSYWNGTYGNYSIDANGKTIPVQTPSNATQQIALSTKGSAGVVQPKSGDLVHDGATTDVFLDGNKLSWGSLLATGHCTYQANAGSKTMDLYYEGYGWYPTAGNYDKYTHNNIVYYYWQGNSCTYDANWNKIGDGNLCNYGGSLIPYHYVIKQSITLDNTDLEMTYSVLGAFGTRTTDSWIVTKQTSNHKNFKPFKTLSNVVPTYGNVTYNVTGGGGPTPPPSDTASPNYVLTVIKGQEFKEVVYDKLVDSQTTVGKVTVKPVEVTSGTTKLYYTLLSGTLTDADVTADNPTKGIIVNGKLVVFKVIAPPTSTQTAALEFN